MARLALFLLGPPRIERDGQAVAVDTRKAIALLAYLAVTRQRHSRDALAGLLWPEYDESHARATLRRTLSALNKALEDDVLEVDREHIGLPPGTMLQLDVDEFHTHLAACSTHGHGPSELCGRCLEPLSRAVAAYTDDFLAGFGLRDSPSFEDWQFFQREGLRREVASALERLALGRAAQRNYVAAIEYGRRWLALDRLHEPAHCVLMRLYAWADQRAAALHQYRECVQILDRELGVPPLETTTQLYEAIKANQPPPAPPPLPNDVEANTPENAPAQMRPTAAAPAPVPATFADVPLFGRTVEWAALSEGYRHAASSGHLLVLEGEAGIGKTRLAEDFLAEAAQRGARILAARCYAGETGLAYGPVVAMLRAALSRPDAPALLANERESALAEVTRLAPELGTLRPGLPQLDPLESPGAQSRFFDGLCKTLLALSGGANAQTRGIIFFDDAHWMDSASLDLLTFLVRRLREYPLFLVLTWRNAEVPPESRLRALLADAQRQGVADSVELSRLGPEAIAEILHASAASGDNTHPPDLAARLYEETEGLPFFVVEYLAALRSGMLAAQGDWWALPGGVRDLLRSRAHAVGEQASQILAAAAVIGRSFDFETVRAASGRGEEETVAAVEELVARRLVQEVKGDASTNLLTYDFSHEKLRTLVYDETSLARRRLLHRRVAEALIARARTIRDPRALASRIAGHYLASGNEHEAADYFAQAGERARSLFANAEALDHLQAALALGHPDAAALHQEIGDVQTLLGEYAAALSSYETTAALVDASALAPIEHKIAGVYLRRGEWERAESHVRDALESWGETGPAADRARALADWSLVARHQGRIEEAQQLAERAFALASAADDPLALAQAHNMLGMLAGAAGRRDEAISHLERSLALAGQLNDPSARIAALNNLALACAARGELARARSLTEEALRLCATQGDRHREAALQSNLADLLRNLGDLEGAREHIEASIAIYMEIGVEAGSLQPEIWKLTEW